MPLESDHTGGHEDPPLLVKWGTRRGLSYPWASGPTPTVKSGAVEKVSPLSEESQSAKRMWWGANILPIH